MNKGKGLGRGIDALFQDIAKLEDVDVKNEQVTEILLNELRPNPYQPRKTFDGNLFTRTCKLDSTFRCVSTDYCS